MPQNSFPVIFADSNARHSLLRHNFKLGEILNWSIVIIRKIYLENKAVELHKKYRPVKNISDLYILKGFFVEGHRVTRSQDNQRIWNMEMHYNMPSERRVGLMVSALDSGASGLGSSIVLCSWARHLTLTVPFSTQVYKWLPADLMPGETL